MKKLRNKILKVLSLGLPLAAMTACTESPTETLEVTFEGKPQIVLTFVTPSDGASTRSSTRATYEDGYEAGIGYEDYINITGGDYRIYFFTYAEGDEKGGTLIAEFKPTEITSASTSSATTYTLTGDAPTALRSERDFRVVMLANWGWQYPNVEEGVTTIDELCEGQYTTFNAEGKFVIEASNLIPFYGVQEYKNVSFRDNERINLDPSLSLLRAVAKVEVIFERSEGEDDFTVDEVNIVNYNAQGYCAPWGVYTAGDYDADYGIQPQDEEWPSVFVEGLHLVNGRNDSDKKTQAFTHIEGQGDGAYDTWRIYLPEYNNMDEDYCYIQVYVDAEPYIIYFADYKEGKTDNTSRYNLKRNNLYRFYVTPSLDTYELHLEPRAWTSILGVEAEVEYTSPITYAGDTYCITMLEVTSTFSITPSLLHDGTAMANVDWKWTYLGEDEASCTETDGIVTMTHLTATPGYSYNFTLVAEWTANDGVTRRSRTYNVKVLLEEGWPVLKQTSRAWWTRSYGSEVVRMKIRE